MAYLRNPLPIPLALPFPEPVVLEPATVVAVLPVISVDGADGRTGFDALVGVGVDVIDDDEGFDRS